MKLETKMNSIWKNELTDAESARLDLRIDAAYAIEQAMKSARVSRSELATKLGTSKSYITKILTGDANLTLDTMASIATALDMSIAAPEFKRKTNLSAWEKTSVSTAPQSASISTWKRMAKAL